MTGSTCHIIQIRINKPTNICVVISWLKIVIACFIIIIITTITERVDVCNIRICGQYSTPCIIFIWYRWAVAVFFFCHSAFIIISIAYRVKAGQAWIIKLRRFAFVIFFECCKDKIITFGVISIICIIISFLLENF